MGKPQTIVEDLEPVKLTRKEKLRMIRELIRQHRLPPWADPYFSLGIPDKKLIANQEDRYTNTLDSRIRKQKDYRDWYLARDHDQLAAKRQHDKQIRAIEEAIHERELDLPFHRLELQQTLENDRRQEELEYYQYLAGLPTTLDRMRAKTKQLNEKHAKEQEEILKKLYDRLWRNSTAAEQLRGYESQAHKQQCTRDLGEQLLFKLMDEMEDFEVDDYYNKLGLDRVSRERAALDAEIARHKQAELQSQDFVLKQIQEREIKKQNDHLQNLVDQKERHHGAEEARFDNFKEAYERRSAMLKWKEELQNQRMTNYLQLEEKEEKRRDREEIKTWMELMQKQEVDNLRISNETKAKLYENHKNTMKYLDGVKKVTNKTSLDQFATEYVKEMQLDTLCNFLTRLKTQQSLQFRVNKELSNQIATRAAERQQEKEEKKKELEEEKVEKERYTAYLREQEAIRRAEARQLADVLRDQANEKKLRDAKVAEDIKSFYANVEKKREKEDEYMRSLAKSMITSTA